MPFMPVILWTDALIYLLMLIAFVSAFSLRKNRQLRGQWRSIFKSRVGAAAAVVLLFYVLVGSLDSIHFHPRVASQNSETQYSPKIVSLLDTLLVSLKNSTEKTYSAPFATHLFVKETMELNGLQSRAYPKLTQRATHLSANADVGFDILTKSIIGSMLGLMVAGLVIALLSLLARQNILKKPTTSAGIQWRSISSMLMTICMLFGALFYLSEFYHVLGTDKVGQDVFFTSIKSIRTGLVIGTLTTLIMLPFAVLLGIMAGYYQGWIDDVIQYIYTTLNSIPGILLIAASILMLQVAMDNNPEAFSTIEARADARLFFLCLILGVTSWTGLCRLLRGETLKLRELDYIQAGKALGTSNLKIILRHILPNVMHIVLISIVLDFSFLVLAEAVLAYIEIGVDPTMNSWGNMINSARLEMSREPIVWWSLFAAFSFMVVLVLAANLFSDAVRDAFDPKLRTR